MINIVIIGAGASGLSAASRLCEHGINPAQITILEAENRIGGRVHTQPYGKLTIFNFSHVLNNFHTLN